jgi:hypothetical protein
VGRDQPEAEVVMVTEELASAEELAAAGGHRVAVAREVKDIAVAVHQLVAANPALLNQAGKYAARGRPV